MAANSDRKPQRVAWFDVQENTFTRWINTHLRERGMHIPERGLKEHFSDGLKLIALLEIISHPKQVNNGRYNHHPRIPIQKMENVNFCIDFMKAENIDMTNIGAGDIVEGNIKLILGLVWRLILRWQINKGGDGGKNELLEWVRSKIPEYNINNFQKDWNDGKAICALTNAVGGGICPDHASLDPKNKFQNASKGMDIAERELGVLQLILPEEMNHPRVDENAMMTYISQFRNAQPAEKKASDASLTQAFGPGLVEGVANSDSDFKVIPPPGSNGKLAVKVIGPNNTAPAPKVKKNADGSYDVQYKPTVAGKYEVHVTLDGEHVPGSVFSVVVLEDVSLGGEGLVVVFFSTTSSTNKGRRDVNELHRLLEAKKLVEPPQFVPIDIMTIEDRNLVFAKSGTRVLPQVYIDDVFYKDYDNIQELEEQGKLDGLLKLNRRFN